jgi:hypothetical protein
MPVTLQRVRQHRSVASQERLRRLALLARLRLDCLDFDWDTLDRPFRADAFRAVKVARLRAGPDLAEVRFRVALAGVAVRFRAVDAAAVRAAVELVAMRLRAGMDGAAVRWAARLALLIALPAALVVLRAARSAVRAADCAATSVDCVALSAMFPAARADVIPVISAARSVSCAMPSTPAANPRPTTVAPVSMRSPTARADCPMKESSLPRLSTVSGFRCFIPPPDCIRHECD